LEPLSDLAEAWTGLELAGEIVAFRYHIVERVLSAGAVTALPFAPDGIEGVVSVAGDVLPVVALGVLLFRDRPAGEQGRELVIVVIAGRRFALRVDGVAFIAAPLSDRVVAEEGSAAPEDGSATWRGRRVTCLAAERLGLERLQPRLPPSAAPGMVADDRIEAVAAHRGNAETVLAVSAGGIECALPAASVAELLGEVAITPVPLVPSVVLGVVVLRRTPLPVLSLACLLGSSEMDKVRFYVVVTGRGGRLVLAVEAIGGLRRADAMPRIFDPVRAIDAKLLALATPLADVADGAGQAASARGGRFLSLSIGDRVCAVPLADVDRIHAPRPSVRLPANVAPGIDGAVEVGGRVIPLTEGRRFLSLPIGERPAGAHVVLRHGGERRVLAVDAVHRVVTIAEHDILSAGDSGQPVAAIGRIGERSIVILSAAQVMAGESAA
jgi:chemotaxis signal transduction protein